jgi:two-component system, OmpR family, phosphate regulon response regulator PhoB
VLTGSPSARERPLILVADDDPDILLLVGLRLERGGYQTLLASDGSQALAFASSHIPDLALLDVDMPHLTGFEVAQRMRSDPSTQGIPVLFLTARRTQADVEAGFEAGARDYLMKPFAPQELEARIGRCLGHG